MPASQVTKKELWLQYTKSCDVAQQPTQGSEHILWRAWKTHMEIMVTRPTGHDVCPFCHSIQSRQAALEDLITEDAKAERKKLSAEVVEHKQFNGRERSFYTSACHASRHHPERVTCLTIDAPTRHQFDLPSQARAKRDMPKGLDANLRWSSKVEGVLDAGVGMMAYVARSCIGGGANLVCTVLMLTLFCHVRLGRPLGDELHLQLDNTTAENKNWIVIALLGWLVWSDTFKTANRFFLHVGHTFNDLDQTFGPLIIQMMRTLLPTIESMLSFLTQKLAVFSVREVLDLPHLWDFKEWFAPLIAAPVKGMATSQQSSGMHHILITKDEQGDVRAYFRQSSQSSTWLPEGAGILIFKRGLTPPAGPPPVFRPKSDNEWRRQEVCIQPDVCGINLMITFVSV